jgi:hypothetical protein
MDIAVVRDSPVTQRSKAGKKSELRFAHEDKSGSIDRDIDVYMACTIPVEFLKCWGCMA